MDIDSRGDNFSEAEISKFFRIRKTVLKMLEDRGYFVSQEQKEKTFEDWKTDFKKDQLCFLTSKISNKDDYIYVEFNSEKKIGVEEIISFVKKINSQNVRKGIIIIRGTISTLAKQKISAEELWDIEYFEEKELIVNITEHELVPTHFPLSEEEKKQLLGKYRLKENQLPKILVSDSIARYFGLKKGNVVKIVRPSETAGRYVTYRIAV